MLLFEHLGAGTAGLPVAAGVRTWKLGRLRASWAPVPLTDVIRRIEADAMVTRFFDGIQPGNAGTAARPAGRNVVALRPGTGGRMASIELGRPWPAFGYLAPAPEQGRPAGCLCLGLFSVTFARLSLSGLLDWRGQAPGTTTATHAAR